VIGDDDIFRFLALRIVKSNSGIKKRTVINWENEFSPVNTLKAKKSKTKTQKIPL
jgi:hypothetical protein